MRGFLPFVGHRIFRALIALWLVSTVVFVVMRLSGDPVPLLLPPDAPLSEILRVRHELGLDRPSVVTSAAPSTTACRRWTSFEATWALRSSSG
jgi:ABC-type dipeptide/oligopeptide/nickel transport system permease component